MPRIYISAKNAVTGEPVAPDDKHFPILQAYAERYAEFLLAMDKDDDLAVIARVCALSEMHLRHAIEAHLAKPDLLNDTWSRMSFRLRVRLALAMDIIPVEMSLLFDAIGSLRNKVLHDNPKQGAISEPDVAKLLQALSPLKSSATTEEAAQLNALQDRFSQKPKYGALEPYQRDLRFALFLAYAVSVAAARRAAPSAEPPDATPTPGNLTRTES
jgi:hypothetical protein